MKILGKFPSTRLRRVRNSDWIRRLISENNLSANDLVMPIFIIEGKNKIAPSSCEPNVKPSLSTYPTECANISNPSKCP